MTKEELDEVVRLHKLWINGHKSGKRADLRGADLTGSCLRWADLRVADLSGADLYGVNMSRADLSRADLSGADLRVADLRMADLRVADLHGADLSGANMSGADLREADLSRADLREADMRMADLLGPDLHRADLLGADLRWAKNVPQYVEAVTSVPPEEGAFVAFKKCREGVVKLQIPESAKRSSATTRKCRASEAVVLELPPGCDTAHSLCDEGFVYRVGTVVKPDRWNECRWEECGGGIHFFMTRAEAEKFSM